MKQMIRFVVNRDEVDPFVVKQLLNLRQLLQGPADALLRSFDDHKQSQWFVVWHLAVHHGLSGKAGA